jgi:hypothetical protein
MPTRYESFTRDVRSLVIHARMTGGNGSPARNTSFKHFGSVAANEVVLWKRPLTD